MAEIPFLKMIAFAFFPFLGVHPSFSSIAIILIAFPGARNMWSFVIFSKIRVLRLLWVIEENF
jgi:hypothetical protein